MTNQANDLITIQETARRLGVTPALVRRMAWKGEIPSVKVRRVVRIQECDLRDYIELNKRRSKPETALTR